MQLESIMENNPENTALVTTPATVPSLPLGPDEAGGPDLIAYRVSTWPPMKLVPAPRAVFGWMPRATGLRIAACRC